MKKKLLIVDDEHHIVKFISARLRARNYEVIEAYDGVQCLTKTMEEIPDLILLDIKMPIMNGIDVFKEIIKLKATKEIPVIFMTAYPNLELKNQALKMGAKGFISKPFISKDLELIIERVINNNEVSEYHKFDPTYGSLYNTS